MRNTYIALSIAFIGADGRILNIEDMQPQTDDTHWSKGAALYALEMKKGWFAERGIAAGDRQGAAPSCAQPDAATAAGQSQVRHGIRVS